MTDYIVNGNDLTSIANKIRAKGQTSAPIVFPGGFEDAVDDLPDEPVLQALSVTANNTYTPGTGVDGFNSVTVNVQPALQSKTATENGTVTPDQGYDGLGSVLVNVPGGGGNGEIHTGTTPPSGDLGADGDVYIQSYQGGILSSTSGATINSGVTINQMFVAEVIVRVDATDTRYSTIFGCRNGTAGRFSARFGGSVSSTLDIHKSATPTASYAAISTKFTKHEMANSGLFYRLLVGLDTSNNTDNFPYPIYLFNNNDAGSVGEDYGDFSMKRFVLTDENGLIAQYLIPAEDNGEACMLDLLDGTYHKNIGNGSFTYTADGGVSERLLWRKLNGSWKAIKMVG